MRSTLAFAAAVVLVCCALPLFVNAQGPHAPGTWQPMSDVPDARTGAAAVALEDGRTLIIGGATNDGMPTNSVAIYDPVANSSAALGELVAPRIGHSATVLHDGRVLVVGGTVNGVVSTDLELFDPASGTSTIVALLPQPRTAHAAARLVDGTVLIVGGSTLYGEVLRSAELFNPADGSLTHVANMQQARTGASATTLIDGRVLVAGGSDGSTDLASAEIFQPFSHTFTIVDTQLSGARSGHTAILLPHNHSVLIAGGTSAGTAVATSDLFLPAEFPDPYSYGIGRFAATGAMTVARTGAVGGPARDNGFVFESGGGSAEAEWYRFATIKTDKDDYAPGQKAIITGSGWEPSQSVTLLFQEDPAVHEDYLVTVIADEGGNIFHDQWAPERHDIGVRFYLIAKQGERRAQTTFTDAELVTSEISGTANDVFVTQGAPVVPSTINLSATGSISNSVTSINPAKVKIHTTYSFNAGVLSSSNFSSELNFFASASGSGNSPITWTGAPAAYGVAANFSADATTPASNYTVSLSEASGRVMITNPNQTGGKLEDTTSTSIAVHVRLAAPSDLVASPASQTQIALSWSDNSTGEAEFWIESAPTAAGPFTFLASVPPGSVSFSHAALSCGTTRHYRIQARKTLAGFVLDSDISGVASATTSSCSTAPASVDDSYTTNEDIPLTVAVPGVLANDTDDDGDVLTVALVSAPTHAASFSLSAGGSFNYTPVADYSGSDSFTYYASDGTLNSTIATVSIAVNSVNDAPTAGSQNVTTNEDTPKAITLAGSDVDGDALTFAIAAHPSHGTLTGFNAATGAVTYEPAENYYGTDSFTFTVNDGTIDSAPATVSIMVNPVNDAPVAVAQSVITDEDKPKAITLAGSDVDGDALTFAIAAHPSHGTLTGFNAATGAVTYEPAENYYGTDSFTFMVNDGTIDSAPATVSIMVNPVNDAPVATAQSVITDEDTPKAITLAGSDVDGDALTFAIAAHPSHGTLTGFNAATGAVTYEPAENYYGTDSFTFTVNDGTIDSAPATVSITINPVNDAPVIGGVNVTPVTINEFDSTTLSGSFADPDPTDSHTITIKWNDGSSDTLLSLGAGVMTFSATHQYKDDDPTSTSSDAKIAVVTVEDSGAPALSTTGNANVIVNNVSPLLNSATPSAFTIPLGSSLSLTVSYSDVGKLDTHRCLVTWDDGSAVEEITGITNTSTGIGACASARTYTSTGVYSISTFVRDDDNGASSPVTVMVTVFDPTGGFVTGGGWIVSPPNACQLTLACLSTSGKANFGFVSKYKKGNNIPDGQTEFQFQAGDLNFHSSAYDYGSLVMAGQKAQYRGTGMINGAPGYKFMITAYDGQAQGGPQGPDRFRIKIVRQADGVVVYDNSMGSSEDIDLSNPTVISGGSIVIHTK